MSGLNWKECSISHAGIQSGELFRFKELCVKPFQSGGFPPDAAVFSEAVFENDQAKFWVSPKAAQLLAENGIDLEKWHAQDSTAPKRNEVSLLVGHYKTAWELLTE